MKARILYSVFLFLASLGLNAQEKLDSKTHVVHVNNPDSMVEAYIYYHNPKLKTDEQRFYHWYSNNSIHASEGGFDGKLLHGIYIVSYPTNKLKEKGAYENGLKTGEWKKWYPNGVIRETSKWTKGQKDGKYCLFSSGGQKVLEAEYKAGKLHGEVITYQDGIIKNKKRYKNGEEVEIKDQRSKVKEKDEKVKDSKIKGKEEKKEKVLKPKKVKLKPVK